MTAGDSNFLLIDIDGLRPDLFASALHSGQLPNFSRLFGGPQLERGFLYPVVAPAPSATFTSQASLITGAHPAQHGIAGNQFFDRFGRQSQGRPRHYGFDVGDQLAFDDAVRVFVDGLASRVLEAPTWYERLAEQGINKTVVAGHMYARGAETWLRPSLINLGRLTKGGSLFGMSAAKFDRHLLEKSLDILDKNGLPQVLTVYFMGVDHESHHNGPQTQATYLTEEIDGWIGELWDAIESTAPAESLPLCAVFSDHGHLAVPSDDRHSLRLGFPNEQEMAPLFTALGLDVKNYPGEDPDSDAVVASNGGLAQVYLRNRQQGWEAAPEFEKGVLRLGRAFWEAHLHGRFAAELEGSLAAVLVRDAESDGWGAAYQALTPEGERIPLEKWFAVQPEELYADPVNRLNHLSGPDSGDLVVLSNSADGFYFGAPCESVHGGLHPEESYATLAFGGPGMPAEEWPKVQSAIQDAIEKRCAWEGNRQPSTADLTVGLSAILG